MATENTENTEKDEWRGATDAAEQVLLAGVADSLLSFPLCSRCSLWQSLPQDANRTSG